MGNATSSAPPILEKDTGNQPKIENQQAASSAPPILEKDTGNQPKIENQQATSSAPPILKKDMGNQPKNENQQATSSASPILKKEMGNQPKNEDQQATSSAPNILKTEEGQAVSAPSAVGLIDSLEQQYHKIKEHAETYPYVWGSYILVYGGFGLWVTYRWRKLRKTEVRVRALQEKLRKLVEAEDSANSAKVVEKGSTSSEKPSK